MNMEADIQEIFEVQYELGFLQRSVAGGITKYPDVAITELVANAHDAGASKVEIIIPSCAGEPLVIEDNGVGMTSAHFASRWMTLSYNRIDHQGKFVEFPHDLKHIKRIAYGRNGIGRHGLLCFSDSYVVETWRDGECNKFSLTANDPNKPLTVTASEKFEKTGHGTRLSVIVERNFKSSDSVYEDLSQRFFSMGDFGIYVNGKEVTLENHPGVVKNDTIVISEFDCKFTLIDTEASRKNSKFQGVGIWIGGRRVGEQTWNLAGYSFSDGRRTFSKRYALVVESDGFRDEIMPDWSGFKPKSEPVRQLAEAISEYVNKAKREVLAGDVNKIKEDALDSVQKDLEGLPDLARKDVADFIDEMLEQNPELDVATLELAVKAAINLERSHLGQNLLAKLANIDPEDVAALDEMLDEWSARDAAKALNEIDSRLKVIEALARLTTDTSADELKTIHPLVLRSRWLFGYEYETTAYSSNVGLVNTIKQVFGKKINRDAFEKSRTRPDIVVLNNGGALAGYAIEDVDSDGHVCAKKVLIIEVKKGGFEVDRDEFDQAARYAEDIINCGVMQPKPYVTAFVVGHQLANNFSPKRDLKDAEDKKLGEVIAKPFSNLISTAEARLFKLRETLSERYDSMKTEGLKEQSLKVNHPLI